MRRPCLHVGDVRNAHLGDGLSAARLVSPGASWRQPWLGKRNSKGIHFISSRHLHGVAVCREEGPGRVRSRVGAWRQPPVGHTERTRSGSCLRPPSLALGAGAWGLGLGGGLRSTVVCTCTQQQTRMQERSERQKLLERWRRPNLATRPSRLSRTCAPPGRVSPAPSASAPAPGRGSASVDSEDPEDPEVSEESGPPLKPIHICVYIYIYTHIHNIYS